MLKNFLKIHNLDEIYIRLQSNIHQVLETIIKVPILSGVLIKDIAFNEDDTDVVISHGLNKNYSGYIIVLKNKAITVFESSTENKMKNQKLILKCSGLEADDSALVSLWVF